ncbi:MAG: hypothetical protein GYA36_19775 [Veillonellaceae bacterium]|nr:hypothetical protein [Veillonellaceae bacterium]
MTKPLFPGSPVVGRDKASGILLARVIDVNASRHTVSIITQQSGRRYTDIPLMYPYAHPERGEGFYVLPEIGAPCWIATEGSGGSPVVLGFGAVPKVVTSGTQDDPNALPQAGDEAMPSYATRRPKRVPGEFGFTSRDGSFLHFRKGGIVELGGGGACQRLFIPLSNHLIDICEGMKQFTAAGMTVFDSDREEGETGEDAKCIWRVMVKANAGDSSTGPDNVTREASVMLEAGNLGSGRFRLTVSPIGIDLKDGSVAAGGEVYTFEVDVSGKETVIANGAVEHVYKSTFDLKVTNNQTESCADRDTTVNTWTIHVNVLMDVMGTAQFRGNVTIGGNLVLGAGMGSGGIIPSGWMLAPVQLAEFIGKYNSHTHSPPGGPITPGGTYP